MQSIHTLEDRLGSLFRKLPRLSPSARRWLAINAWWIILVIAIIDALTIIYAFTTIFAIANLATYNYVYQYRLVPVSVLVTNAIVTVVLNVISVILLFAAVKPLKVMQRRGWDLLFLYELISAILAIATFVILILRVDVWGLIWSLIIVAIELYLLFEVRSEFGGRVANARRAKVIEPKK